MLRKPVADDAAVKKCDDAIGVLRHIVVMCDEHDGLVEIACERANHIHHFGFGFGKGIPKKKFNVNIDLGAYYLQSPTVTAIGTKLLTNNQANADIIQNNMKDYRFMPVAQLNFNFKF